jgi:hypothetical protein
MRPLTPKKIWTNTTTKTTKNGGGKITVTLKGKVGQIIKPYLDKVMSPKN